jgi:preprotein translocase subunit SecY
MTDLVQRIAFTITALLICRLGTFVLLPGLDPTRLYGGGPGFPHRLAIFSLGVIPYIWASIIVQLIAQVSPRLRALKRGGAQGRRAIDRITRYLAALLAAGQAWGVAIGIAGVPDIIVVEPRWLFMVSTVVTLTGGTLFLVWLAEQITLRGVGNGLILMLLLPIFTALPNTLADLIETGRQGLLTSDHVTKLIFFVVGFVVFAVLMERARRVILIHYPERRIGTRTFAAQMTYLPLKLNGVGIIPVLMASSVMSMPVASVKFGVGPEPSWLNAVAEHLRYGQPLHLAFYALLVFFFALIYSVVVFDPAEMAEALQKRGGSIATIARGEATAADIDRTLSRITLAGACYLVVLVVVWEMFAARFPVPLHFGVISLLIVVCATVDLDSEVRARLRCAGTAPEGQRGTLT